MHLPGHALSLSAAHDLATFSCPAFRCSVIENYAALTQMVIHTVPNWRHWHFELHDAAARLLQMKDAALGMLEPAFWNSQPILFLSASWSTRHL